MQYIHPSGIKQEIVDKVVARRGRLHAFESLMPEKTALVVVDLDSGTVRRWVEHLGTLDIVAPINEMVAALRQAGGVVAWVTTPIAEASDNFRAIFGEKTSDMYEEEGRGEATTVWHELDTQPDDIYVTKTRSSAFFPANCNLHDLLKAKGIDTVLIVGTVTNICCYASAVDAAELDYRVTMVSDAMQGHAHGLPEAMMATFFRAYGDVRPSGEVLELINQAIR